MIPVEQINGEQGFLTKWAESVTCLHLARSAEYTMFSLDIMAAILVSQNNGTAVMLVSQTKHVGFELYSYVYTFFYWDKYCMAAIKETLVWWTRLVCQVTRAIGKTFFFWGVAKNIWTKKLLEARFREVQKKMLCETAVKHSQNIYDQYSFDW